MAPERPTSSRAPFSRRLPRDVHPVAWWLWALALATTVAKLTNPLLLALVLGVLSLVVTSRRVDAPWSRALKYYLVLGLAIVLIRVVFRSVFGGDTDVTGSHVLFTLPRIPLPGWAAGVQLGGPVTLEGTLGALYGGLQLGCLLCCLGAANALANPKRALRSLPRALYELGAAVVVAFNVAPQLVESVQRVRRSRRLRGESGRWRHAVRTIGIPVLQDALDRSLGLAASMDSRGYGRVSTSSPRSKHSVGILMIAGLFFVCLGAYGLADPSPLGPSALAVGVALCLVGLGLGRRRVAHTRYRPDPWLGAEWLVVVSGLVPLVVVSAHLGGNAALLNPSVSPPSWPSLPLGATLAILVAALPAVATPPPASRAQAVTGRQRPEPTPANGREAPVARHGLERSA
jgi:energy-coupling factor transport system permease protein